MKKEAAERKRLEGMRPKEKADADAVERVSAEGRTGFHNTFQMASPTLNRGTMIIKVAKKNQDQL